MSRVKLGKSLNLKTELIPIGRPNRKRTQIRPTSITMHNTSNENKGADADAHSRFVRKTGYYMWKGKKRWVSWHYTVDDKQVIKHLPIHELALHAGRANGSSIAIEVCMHSDNDQQSANDRAARLVAVLLFDLGLNTQDIKTHKYWTNKNCPILLLEDFGAFTAKVKAYLDEIVDDRELESAPFSSILDEDPTDELEIELDHEELAKAIAMAEG